MLNASGAATKNANEAAFTEYEFIIKNDIGEVAECIVEGGIRDSSSATHIRNGKYNKKH